MTNKETENRISTLREILKANNLDAIIIPTNDPHQSEYLAEHWQVRTYFSGFDGSAGTLVVGTDFATLWTDSRYWLQAEDQLAGTGIKLGRDDRRSSAPFLEELLAAGAKKVVVNGKQVSLRAFQSIQKAFAQSNSKIELVLEDIINEIWTDRPALPNQPVFVFETKYAGQATMNKVEIARQLLERKKADYFFVTALDDIAWLFNLRGSDVSCNPVFYAFALISETRTTLYLSVFDLIDEEVKSYCTFNRIELKPYKALGFDLEALSKDTKVAVDASDLSAFHHNLLDAHQWVFVNNPIRQAKGIKNEIEIAHWRTCMEQDGLALAKAFQWLEENVEHGVSEDRFAEVIAEKRSENPLYKGESFDAIVGYQSNGAIVHYRPEKGKSKVISNEGILLVDCGGQYLNGTTDITRTIAFSEPTAEQKMSNTLVLKGHIALDHSIFRKGTNGQQLDMMARQFLWQEQLNFGHGTGHGVGFFLNVHEGPQGISAAKGKSTQTPFLPGMVTSNEPAFYVDGEYGIRIENLILCCEADSPEWLRFETLTLFPLDVKLIDFDLLEASELQWLRAYHLEVQERLCAIAEGKTKKWITEMCAPFVAL